MTLDRRATPGVHPARRIRASDRPAYHVIADDLRHLITTGDWPPGHKLPSEIELLNHYRVSRVTARNAIAHLRREGLILSHHGKGSYVRNTHPTQTRLATRHTTHNPTTSTVVGWLRVHARMPTPDETHTHQIPLGTPVLVITTPTDRDVQVQVLPADRTLFRHTLDLPPTSSPRAALVGGSS